jgi:LEA14-like dessication related protein
MKVFAKMRSVIPALLLLGLSSCSTLGPKLEPPQLDVVKVAMTSGDIFSQNFLVHLNVKNPNDRELPIKAIEYQLFLQGDSFAEGTNSRPFVVPANGETDFDMTVRTNFVSGVARLLTRLNGRSKVEYILEGTVHLQSGVLRKIPFQESGVVDLATVR